MRSWLGLLPLLAVGTPATAMAAAGDADKGKPIFVAQCSVCHGKTGDGNGPVGKTLTPRPKAFAKGSLSSDEKMTSVIRKGGKANGLSKDMDAYPALTEDQVSDVIAYIKTLAK